MIDYKKLSRPLTREEIDFRVGATSLFGGKASATILAYKDARVDMNILDEVAGPGNWQCSFERDTKGILQAKIGIWNFSLEQWIWKTSNGIESNTEKQKGEYSDAFKRAGFMWGIGRELYNFPRIKIDLKEKEFTVENGKVKMAGWFNPNSWEWIIGDGLIMAKDRGDIRFKQVKNIQEERVAKKLDQHIDNTSPMTDEQRREITDMLAHGLIEDKERKSIEKALPIMDKLRADEAIKWLSDTIDEREQHYVEQPSETFNGKR